MREFVQRFCAARHRPSKLHCNLLLRSISLHPKSNDTGALVRQVLEKMAQHGIKARKQTLNALLHPDFLTLEIASAVEQKMTQDDIAPTRHQLQCLCQLMIAHRYRAKAARYLRKLKLKTKEEKAAWTGPDKLLQARFIRAFRRPTLALKYLTRLVTSRNRRARGVRRWQTPVVNVHQWLYTLHVASRSPHVSSANLLDTFRQSTSAYPLNRAAYSTVIRGLLSKRDYANAGALWEEAFSHSPPSNTWTVAVGASVLTMNGQSDRAFQLLEDVHATHFAATDKRRYARVSLRALHQFMVSLHRMGRPDVVFTLFDHMETVYSLRPDVYTINILLQTARWARKFEDTIRGQLAVIGFELSPRPGDIESPENPRTQPVSRIKALLDPNRRSWVTGRWNSEPAGQVALKHALQVFLGNWPWLSDVPPPVQALRRAGEDAARRPLGEVINRTVERAPYETSPLLALLPDVPSAVYPEVMPTDVTFRTLVDLLAAQALQAEIPRVLAWMRALDIRPSKTTLATALVHWVDVSMDSPFIERLKGTGRRDPYALLLAWMEDWAGAERMPQRDEMAEEMRRAAYYRDVNYLDIISERNRAAAARRTGK
ncbi:hypothetical protein PsYK624_091110 [Phanerochaete sordida]|uniref:Pentacotripeptide-repeat region of PRORP domain-containing protein n=1 Tax=Phanerochaete sordida TaxID=48140 RepID=A0A9P3LGC7_9APHY|nr:hypothetical protein PsYK624_091110 [Phanerochaete sordida]